MTSLKFGGLQPLGPMGVEQEIVLAEAALVRCLSQSRLLYER